eukprot:CAMPEP_0178448610 /NCGR_PEP_ID=MMETSP0689_2-20121128/42083_1 /TAXON_ID=160604 /ORGANISM="Amphidinium massartii, Strain CS-259" /LENGTH=206 /DNA_ID=CAMNT_0020073821 /DNA_START=99 /DNA_END=716 /DNA_ORIENTATION=+
MAKLTLERLQDASVQVLARQATSAMDGRAKSQRSFRESVDLQLALRGYDVKKDRRFAGSVHLPHIVRPEVRVCLLAGDDEDVAKADRAGIRYVTFADVRAWNRNKKLIKRFSKSADHFLCSASMIRIVPRLMGPCLSKMSKFPAVLTKEDDLDMKIMEYQCLVKFRMKKELTLGTAIGHVDMLPAELLTNCLVAVNFLVSLLKKNW